MASSALPSVLEYLEKALGEAEDLDGVSVLWGPPLGDDTPKEFVAVGFGEDGTSGTSDRDFIGLGTGKLDESIEVKLTTAVALVGVDLKTAYDRSYEIAGAVEDVIRGDIHLGGLIRNGRLGKWRGEFFRVEQAQGHRINQTLTGIARI